MSVADLMKKGSLQQFATVTVATVATDRPDSLPSVASVATVSVAMAQKQAANDAAAVTQDLDRWAWPHSQAMTGREIDTFTVRLHQFTGRGLVEPDAERLADKLVKRDRVADDRRLCLECDHLAGRAEVWGCRNWQRAGIASMARQAQLSAALVNQHKRCEGFTAST
ncbi:MAG: hypothetical protein HQ446_07095 [Polaromonas sp.]|nr:hypothetical protein [Polaromonas sp.]